MNRTEQKEILKDILVRIKDLKDELEGKEKETEAAFDKIGELGDVLGSIAQVDSWDEEQLKLDLISAIIEDSSLSEVYDELYEFNSELESFMDEISEGRREKLEERYEQMESALEMLEQDAEDESIDNVIDRIVESENLIREMYK